VIYLCKLVGMPFLKVGYSENFASRLYSLNRSMPFEVECLAERNGSIALEQDIHKMCADFVLKNEWYPDIALVRDAFFKCFDRYPNLSQKELTLRKKQERKEFLLAYDLGRYNLWGNVIPKTGASA